QPALRGGPTAPKTKAKQPDGSGRPGAEHDVSQPSSAAPTKIRKPGRSGRSTAVPRGERSNQNRNSSRAGFALAAAGAIAVLVAGASLVRMASQEPNQADGADARRAVPQIQQAPRDSTRVQALSSAADDSSPAAP